MADIMHRVGIEATPQKVFKALSTIEGYRGWWDPSAKGNPAKGGLVTFFEHFDMKVLECKPGQRVKWVCVRGAKEWLGTEMLFELKKGKGQTFLLFTHSKWKKPVDFMRHCSMKWAVYLLSLKQLVETGKGRPYPKDIPIERGN